MVVLQCVYECVLSDYFFSKLSETVLTRKWPLSSANMSVCFQIIFYGIFLHNPYKKIIALNVSTSVCYQSTRISKFSFTILTRKWCEYERVFSDYSLDSIFFHNPQKKMVVLQCVYECVLSDYFFE